MAYRVGDTIRDTFSILDDVTQAPILGAEITVDQAIDPSGGTFNMTITELGAGVYQLEFLATQFGEYYYLLHTDSTTPSQYFEESFDVEKVGLTPTIVTVTGINSDFGTTLYDILPKVAAAAGDFLELYATADGSPDGTSLTDNIRLAAIPAGALKGANIWMVGPTDGPNFWVERRIQATQESTQTASLTPPLPTQVKTGDVAWVTNIESRGFPRQTYIRVVNDIIQESFPRHLMAIESTTAEVLDPEVPYIAVPTQFTHLYGVESTLAGIQPLTVPYAPQGLGFASGWTYDPTTQNIILSSDVAAYHQGRNIRLMGYGKPGILVEPTDMTTISLAYLVPKVVARLRTSKGDQRMLAVASMDDNRAEEWLPSTVTQIMPNTIRIR